MNIEFFLKQFLEHNSEIECDNGLKLVWEGEFETTKYKDNEYEIPVYKVSNPNNSPYTRSALEYHVESSLYTFRKMLPILENYIPNAFLYIVDSLDIYISPKTEMRLTNCLGSISIEDESFSIDGQDVVISGSFTGDYEMDLDDVTVICICDFQIDSVTVDGEDIYYDEDEFDRIKDEIYDYDSDWFDIPTWSCLSQLYNSNNFVSKDDMGWNTGVRLII